MRSNDLMEAAITRAEAIQLLRGELRKLTNEKTSICKAVTERGVFCRGFDRFSDDELRETFHWLGERAHTMSRRELERVANRWHLARQEMAELPLACDVQTRVRDTCSGWSDFSADDLSRFYFELTGRRYVIAGGTMVL